MPVGKASVLPLVGAPDGPLFTYCPFNELINDKNKREELSKNIKLFGNPSASAKIADFAENIIG